MLAIGAEAPDFTAPRVGGEDFVLSEALAEREVLLYFFPKTFTPVCTKQCVAFSERVQEGGGPLVVGVSPDDDATTARFVEQMGLAQVMVLDPGGEVAARYDVRRVGGWLPNQRVSYRISREGRVKAAHHAELMVGGHLDLLADEA